MLNKTIIHGKNEIYQIEANQFDNTRNQKINLKRKKIKLRQRILRVLSSMKERKILASASKTVLQVNLTFLEFLT